MHEKLLPRAQESKEILRDGYLKKHEINYKSAAF